MYTYTKTVKVVILRWLAYQVYLHKNSKGGYTEVDSQRTMYTYTKTVKVVILRWLVSVPGIPIQKQ